MSSARAYLDAAVLDAVRADVDRIEEEWAAWRSRRDDLAHAVERGVAAQQTGTAAGVAAAIAAYREVLARDPEHADALHLLGLALHAAIDRPSLGDESPVALLRRAIRAAPGVALYHMNLGELLIASGALAASADAFIEALELAESSGAPVLAMDASEGQALWQLVAVLGDVGDNVRVVETFTRWSARFDVPLPGGSSAEAGVRRRKRRPLLIGRAATALFALAQQRPAGGACAWEPGRGEAQLSCAEGAVALLKRAVALPDAPLALRFQLASVLAKLSESAAADSAAASDAVAAFDVAVQLRQRDAWLQGGRFVARVPRPRRPTTIVAIYCNEYNQSWWGQWGASSVDRGGLGGSEESVVFLSRALVKLGVWVEVYADPPLNETGLQPDGVVWYPWSAFPPSRSAARAVGLDERPVCADATSPRATPSPTTRAACVDVLFDAAVSWRYGISAVLSAAPGAEWAGSGDAMPLAAKSYVWLQDTGPGIATLLRSPNALSRLDAIFVLSEFHASQLRPESQRKVVVSSNALHPKFFQYARAPHAAGADAGAGAGAVEAAAAPPQRMRNSFVYASAPNRGLETVLQCWGEIRRRIAAQERASAANQRSPAEATLTVYYGFSPAFLKWGRGAMAGFEAWLERMRTLLLQPGVRYVGMVDHHALAEAYAATEFYLYPTTFPETGCVAMMKALALGAVPITSRHPHSTLPELTREWDLGPVPPDGAAAMDEVWTARWVESVVRAAAPAEAPRIAAHRAAMMEWAQHRYRWSNTARVWLDQIRGGGEAAR
jgi:glycosyltransferase involved in cell wall biosynthesis